MDMRDKEHCLCLYVLELRGVSLRACAEYASTCLCASLRLCLHMPFHMRKVRGAQVICEEAANAYHYGSKSTRKERFPAGIVTPAAPEYVYGSVDDDSKAADFDEVAPRPLLGVAFTKTGYTVSCLDVACVRTTHVTAPAMWGLGRG